MGSKAQQIPTVKRELVMEFVKALGHEPSDVKSIKIDGFEVEVTEYVKANLMQKLVTTYHLDRSEHEKALMNQNN